MKIPRNVINFPSTRYIFSPSEDAGKLLKLVSRAEREIVRLK